MANKDYQNGLILGLLARGLIPNPPVPPGPTDDYHAYDNPVVIYNGEVTFADNEGMLLGMIPLDSTTYAEIKHSGKMNFAIDDITYIDDTIELPFIIAELLGSVFAPAWGNVGMFATMQGMDNISYPTGENMPFIAIAGENLPLFDDTFTGIIILSFDPSVLGEGTHTVSMEMLGDRDGDANNILTRGNYLSNVLNNMVGEVPGCNYQSPIYWITEDGGNVAYHISPVSVRSNIVDGTINVLPQTYTSASGGESSTLELARIYTDEQHQEEYYVTQTVGQKHESGGNYYQGIVVTGAETVDSEGTPIDELDFNYCDFMDVGIKNTTDKSAYSIPPTYHKNRELSPRYIGTSQSDTKMIGLTDILSDKLGYIQSYETNLLYTHIWEGISAGNIRDEVDTITLTVKLVGESDPYVLTVDPRLFYDATDATYGASKMLGYNDQLAYAGIASLDRATRRAGYMSYAGITQEQLDALKVDNDTDFCLMYSTGTHYLTVSIYKEGIENLKLFEEVSIQINYK